LQPASRSVQSEGIPVFLHLWRPSFGVPIIATDVGGTSEAVVEGENGFLIPSKLYACILLENYES